MAIELTKKDISWLKEKYSDLKPENDTFLSGEINFNREFDGIPFRSSYLFKVVPLVKTVKVDKLDTFKCSKNDF